MIEEGRRGEGGRREELKICEGVGETLIITVPEIIQAMRFKMDERHYWIKSIEK